MVRTERVHRRSVNVDLRVGGAYRIAVQPPEGELFYLRGEFRAIDPPAYLSYTFRYEDPDPEARRRSSHFPWTI